MIEAFFDYFIAPFIPFILIFFFLGWALTKAGDSIENSNNVTRNNADTNSQNNRMPPNDSSGAGDTISIIGTIFIILGVLTVIGAIASGGFALIFIIFLIIAAISYG